MKYEKNNEAFEFDEDWANRHNQQSQSISGSGSSKTAHEIDGSELVKGSMKPRDYAMVGVLFVVNLLNYMDRYTVAGVLTNVQRHFCINDEWGGFLQTIFIVSYLLFAPIIGYLGDRYSRKVLIIWGLAVWISSVLGSSFIPGYTPEIDPVSGKTLNHNYNFVYFLICRGLVGIGEASYSTIAPAMLSDMFTSTTRSKVLMLFYIAIPVGSGLGYMVGSKVAELAIQWGAVDGWQWGLRVTPALGMICIFCLIFIVREPERGQAEKNAGATMIVKRTSYIKDIGYLLKHKTYISATLGFTAVTFVTGTLAWWAPTAVNYAYQWQKDSRSTITLAPSTVTPIVTTNTTILSTCENGDDIPKDPSVDLIFGALTCVAGLLGVVVATMISKLWKEGKFCFRRIKTVRADAILCAIGSVLAIAPLFGGLHTIAHLPGLSWVLIFCAITFLCLNWAILTDMLMYTVLPHRRSTASALQISISHLFGDASGPWIIGAVSDAIRGTDGSAKAHFNSLLTAFYIPIAAVVVSAIMFLVSIYTVKEDVERFQATMGMIEKPKANIDTNFVVLKGKDTGHENATFAQE